MLNRSEHVEQSAVASDVAIAGSAALLLVPAAVALDLYPLSLILGTVSFDTASISLWPLRLFLIVPIVLGLVLVWRRKDWLLAVMLVPGIALALIGPDRIGSRQPSEGHLKAFYPYAAADVDARIGEIGLSINDAGWLFAALPPRLPPMDGLLSRKQFTDEMINSWQLLKMAFPEKAAELEPVVASKLYELKADLESLERLVAFKSILVRAPYIITASISFALFIFVAGFRNWAMAGLVIVTALACLWSAWPISLEDWVLELPLILYPAFVCALSAFVVRFAYRGYLDNVQLIEKFERHHLISSVSRAIFVWLPFPAVVTGAVLLNILLYHYASSAIYCGSTNQFCGSVTSEPPIRDSDPSRDTLRDDINAMIYRLLAKFETEAVRAAEAARSNVAEQMAAAQKQVISTFDGILPENLYQIYPDLTPPSRCSWFPLPNVKCFARKIALERLNAAYQSPRNRLRERLLQALADVGSRVTAGVVNAATGFQNAIKGESQRAALHATKTVDATFIGFNVFGIAQMALMLLVSMRALLLIFGRMIYRDNPSRSKPRRAAPAELPCLALTHSERENAATRRFTVKHYPDELELRDDKHLPLLTKRLYNVDDADQVTLVFGSHYATWPLRRLVNGCLILTGVTRLSGKDSIRFTTVGGRQLIVWNIPAGVEVFFRWDRFVAMTASMNVKKTISLRVGGLATGTTMQASVVGPGLLIQESSGQVELTHEEKTPGSVFPSRLLSWESGSQFRIKSPRPLSSVYFDPPSLDVERGARAVLDSSGDRRRGLGLLRELMRLCHP